MMEGSGSVKKEKKPRRVIGPEKPSFLDTGSDNDSWVPPKGKLFSHLDSANVGMSTTYPT